MLTYFERLLFDLLVEKSKGEKEHFDCKEEFTPQEITGLYRQVMDKIAVKMITDSFENETILQAIMRLSRLERIIIAFNILQDMELKEIALLLDTTSNNVYSQKSKAGKALLYKESAGGKCRRSIGKTDTFRHIRAKWKMRGDPCVKIKLDAKRSGNITSRIQLCKLWATTVCRDNDTSAKSQPERIAQSVRPPQAR